MRLMLDVSYSHRGPVDREFWCIIRTVRIEDLLGVGVVSRAVILPADSLPQLYLALPAKDQRQTLSLQPQRSPLRYNFIYGGYKDFGKITTDLRFESAIDYSDLSWSVYLFTYGVVRVSRSCGQASPKG